MIFCFWWAIFFLLTILWQLIKAIWWIILLILIGGLILSHTDWRLSSIKKYSNISFYYAIRIFFVVLIIWRIWDTAEFDINIAQDDIINSSSEVELIDTTQIIAVNKNNSIPDKNILPCDSNQYNHKSPNKKSNKHIDKRPDSPINSSNIPERTPLDEYLLP